MIDNRFDYGLNFTTPTEMDLMKKECRARHNVKMCKSCVLVKKCVLYNSIVLPNCFTLEVPVDVEAYIEKIKKLNGRNS